MGYTPTTWINKLTRLNAKNLNHLETQYASAVDDAALSFLYNRHADNTNRIRAALAKAAAGLGRATILLAGDSTTSQTLVGYSRDLLTEALERTGMKAAGDLVIANRGGQVLGVDERITLTGGWTPAESFLNSNGTTAALSFTSTHPGTVAELRYMSNTPARWRVDGGPWNDLAQVGLAITPVQIGGLSDAVHTIDLEVTAGASLYLGSLAVLRSSGVLVVNAGANGTATGEWTQDVPWTYGPFAKSLGPDAVFINFGINDRNSGSTPAQVKAQHAALIDLMSPADVFLETSNPTGVADYSAFNAVKHELSDEKDIPLVDIGRRFGTYDQAHAAGLYADGDTVHPNLAGYVLKATGRLAALTSH